MHSFVHQAKRQVQGFVGFKEKLTPRQASFSRPNGNEEITVSALCRPDFSFHKNEKNSRYLNFKPHVERLSTLADSLRKPGLVSIPRGIKYCWAAYESE
jgi:hypothetical protein